MTKDPIEEALDLALEALDNLLYWDNGKSDYDQAREAITAIKQALAAPVQEPVAWQVHPFDYGIGHEGVYARTDRPEQVEMWKRKGWTVQPLYTTPPGGRQSEDCLTAAQRQWVGLTDEEIGSAYEEAAAKINYCAPSHVQISRAIEAKLKEKNT
jgi:hypothetical protein